MLLEQGHIILIPIPFTDLSSTKRRPVILISNSTYSPKHAGYGCCRHDFTASPNSL